MNVDQLIREAMRRIKKAIERRHQIAMGRKPSTAARSAGQLFGKRGKYGRTG